MKSWKMFIEILYKKKYVSIAYDYQFYSLAWNLS